MLEYRGGLKIPSWTASNGTLRLMALTSFAYVSGREGVFLETMFRSLSNVYDAQVLLATHSPLILALEARYESALLS